MNSKIKMGLSQIKEGVGEDAHSFGVRIKTWWKAVCTAFVCMGRYISEQAKIKKAHMQARRMEAEIRAEKMKAKHRYNAEIEKMTDEVKRFNEKYLYGDFYEE